MSGPELQAVRSALTKRRDHHPPKEKRMNVKRLTQAAIVAAALAATGTPVLAQSTNSTTFDNWATDTARQHNGRITRDVYLDEMGRRWDADPNHTGTREAYLRDLRTRWDTMDRGNRGLTPAEVSGMTGKVDSSTSGVPKTGSGAQPGNMGPSNSKGQ